MTRPVPLCAFVAHAVFFIVFGACVVLSAPRQAHASDGYEVGFAAAAVMVPTLALDVTFIVASATGLTYDDEGWAIAQVIWSVASMGGCAVGIAYAAQEPGFEGLVGGMALIGGAQAVYLGVALHALGRAEWNGTAERDGPPFGLSLAPMPGGVVVSAAGAF